ncbi:hypothetical protein M2103_002169 [Ereboglobus sp. PH5-5]|uniref:Uncharacterized protein n=1 Tax=Ereboglobus luteus TaxID=1796921 RepID=A0A2U8E1U6_9BACT|nr:MULTISPECIES: hypothetical protein [Ereboglobus]AWI08780.1 hypothetical protein CKA38_05490 [Ereboglobus luteus]MDF9827370.1 hypothetical protein [Ereboglobus sp. PH5-10]MDF9833934.1 hypothetical protein [Ereboglobus sp. PH5-5]
MVRRRQGHEKYLQYLKDIGNDEQAQKQMGLVKLSRGWALGTHGWKQALAREYAHKTYAEGMNKEEAGEIQELHWEGQLEAALKAAGRKPGDLKTTPRLRG